MRFLRLDLERFGHFRGPKLVFDGAPSMLLVHGNNEAGKTTVLEAIRWLLFGGKGDRWAPISSGAISSGSDGETSQLAVGARVALTNGKTMEIRRTKGRGGGLRGSSGTGDDFDEEWILAQLTRPNRVVFENVFGFSLSGLADGAKALEHASLRNVIYGGGLGTVQPDTILHDLREESAKLFTETGRSQAIHVRLKKLQEQRDHVTKTSMRAAEWEHLRQDVEDKQAHAGKASEAWRARRREEDRLKASIEAIEPQRRIASARESLERLPIVALPASAGVEHASLVAERAAYAAALVELDDALASANDVLASLVIDESVLARQREIEALARDLPAFRAALRDRPARADELAAIERHAGDRLRALRADWDLDRLRGFQVEVVARTAFDEACAAHDVLSSERSRIAAALRQIEDDLRENAAARAALPPATDTAAIRAWLETGAEVLAERKTLGSLETQLRGLEKRCASARAKLDPPPSADLRVPDAETIGAFEDEASSLEGERRRIAEEVRARREAATAEPKGKTKVPTEAELHAAREARDELLDQLLDSKATAAKIRAHASAVRDADDLADRMRAHADVVQRRAMAERAMAELAEALEEEKQLATNDFASRWTAAWRGVNPKSPFAMRAWVAALEDARGLEEDVADANRRALEMRERIAAWQSRGASLLGTAGTIDELRAIARERAEVEEKRASEVRVLEKQRAREEPRRDALVAERDRNDAALSDLTQRMPLLLSAMGLERELSVSAARALLTGLHEARMELVPAETALRAQLARLDQLIEQFRERADEQTVEPLEQQLHLALSAVRTRDETLRTRTELLSKIERTRKKHDAASAAIERLHVRAGAADEETFRERVRAREQRDSLTAAIEADERLLATLQVNEDVRELDADTARRTLAALEDECDLLDKERSEHDRAVGDAAAKLRAVDGRQDAAEALATLESERAALFEEVERYAVLALSERLLRNAIARFERENQPTILHRASKVLGQMTRGRYAAIRKSGDGLKVERGDGTEISPDVLSTGTREQMYLAIRLAYVEHYCASAEPLPVVLDDVLVNFDDERARATLEALTAFSSTTQVILFTCHQSTIALAKEAGIAAQTLQIPAAS